jgi:hypothetical protein
MVSLDQMDNQEPMVVLAVLDQEVIPDQQVLLEMLVNRVQPAPQDLKGQKERLEQKVALETLDQRANKVHLGLLVIWVCQVRSAVQVLREQLVLLEALAQQDLVDQLDQVDQQDHKGLQVQEDLPDLLDQLGPVVNLVMLVQQDLLDKQVMQAQMATRVLKETKDLQVSLVKSDHLDHQGLLDLQVQLGLLVEQELRVLLGTSGFKVQQDLPVCLVQQDLKVKRAALEHQGRLDHLEIVDNQDLLVLVEIQAHKGRLVQKVTVDQLVLKDHLDLQEMLVSLVQQDNQGQLVQLVSPDQRGILV